MFSSTAKCENTYYLLCDSEHSLGYVFFGHKIGQYVERRHGSWSTEVLHEIKQNNKTHLLCMWGAAVALVWGGHGCALSWLCPFGWRCWLWTVLPSEELKQDFRSLVYSSHHFKGMTYTGERCSVSW